MKSFLPIALASATSLFAFQAARAEVDVVASIKPLHSLVAAVMEGTGEPTLLVEGAASPHNYSLKPSQARTLENAEVIFWIGENLEAFLEKPVATIGGNARSVELVQAPGVETIEFGEEHAHHHGEADHEEAGHEDDDDDHEEAGHEDGDGHHHEGVDPHIWLDPHNAEAMVSEIAAVLAEADPDNAETYENNAAALQTRIEELEDGISTQLEALGDESFIVFHDGYQYFVGHFGLHQAGALTLTPEVSPGAAQVAEIQSEITDAGAKCVFAEPQFQSSLIDVVTEGTDARTGTLDPLGADLTPGPELYFELMNGMATSFSQCLGE